MNPNPIARAWRDSVLDAINRLVSRRGVDAFKLQALLQEELDRIVIETQSHGATPEKTLHRTLQDLRDEGLLEFIDNRGTYRITKLPVNIELTELSDEQIDTAIQQRLLRIGRVDAADTIAEGRRRRGQARIRVLTLYNYGTRCAVCDVHDPALLVASHVVPWANAPDARGDLANIVCLCRFHDALFEIGYWSLKDDLTVLRRSPLSSQTIKILLPEAMSFRPPTAYLPNANYLHQHRTRHGFKNPRRRKTENRLSRAVETDPTRIPPCADQALI